MIELPMLAPSTHTKGFAETESVHLSPILRNPSISRGYHNL